MCICCLSHNELVENGLGNVRRPCCSKAAVTHSLKKLKTLAKCRECEAYVYFQGVECNQVTCHFHSNFFSTF